MVLDESALLTRTAHELRVPLSLIAGSLDALAQYTDAMLQFIATLAAAPLSSEEQRQLSDQLRLAYATEHAPEVLQICREGARRLTHVVERLRVSGQRAALPAYPVLLAPVVHAALRMLSHISPANLRVDVSVDERLCVRANADTLGQVFVNLLRNALDSVVGSGAPAVSVCATLLETGPASMVEIHVRDNGAGIPQSLRERIFEPFFSTKPPGEGVGLGLAIVSDLLLGLRGSIELAPTTSGSEFIVRLPACAPQADATLANSCT